MLFEKSSNQNVSPRETSQVWKWKLDIGKSSAKEKAGKNLEY